MKINNVKNSKKIEYLIELNLFELDFLKRVPIQNMSVSDNKVVIKMCNKDDSTALCNLLYYFLENFRST